MLMWSYYSEGHAGIAIRFNMSTVNLALIPYHFIILEVKYETDLSEDQLLQEHDNRVPRDDSGDQISRLGTRERVAPCAA